MAWALYLSSSDSALSDAQLAELDDYELASRSGTAAASTYLSTRLGPVVQALVCTAGSLHSRSAMLRSVTLLHSILTSPSLSPAPVLRLAVSHLLSQHQHSLSDDDFLAPLLSIAVNRVSDVQLSTAAAHALAILLGCKVLDDAAANERQEAVYNAVQTTTKRLVALLITEVVLTSSPHALAALAVLLRRDGAKKVFCEKDGVSTLAATLQTHPHDKYTAIGQVVANNGCTEPRALKHVGVHHPPTRNSHPYYCDNNMYHHHHDVSYTYPSSRSTCTDSYYTLSDDSTVPQQLRHDEGAEPLGNNAIYASYHAVFAVWTLSFVPARYDDPVTDAVLSAMCVARLPAILARLLAHASGQRLKIARLTLAALRNLAARSDRVRTDLVRAGVLAALRRLLKDTGVRGSLIGTDDDARADATELLQLLQPLAAPAATLTVLRDELITGPLSAANPWHSSDEFWRRHATDALTDVLVGLSRIVRARATQNDKHDDHDTYSSTSTSEDTDTGSEMGSSSEEGEGGKEEEKEQVRRAVVVPMDDESVRVACEDLTMIMRYAGKRGRAAIVAAPGLRDALMAVMVREAVGTVRNAALVCVQTLLVHRPARK